MHELYARNVPGLANRRSGAGGLRAAPALAGARWRPADPVFFLVSGARRRDGGGPRWSDGLSLFALLRCPSPRTNTTVTYYLAT